MCGAQGASPQLFEPADRCQQEYLGIKSVSMIEPWRPRMARNLRLDVPGVPQHIVQRGGPDHSGLLEFVTSEIALR